MHLSPPTSNLSDALSYLLPEKNKYKHQCQQVGHGHQIEYSIIESAAWGESFICKIPRT